MTPAPSRRHKYLAANLYKALTKGCPSELLTLFATVDVAIADEWSYSLTCSWSTETSTQTTHGPKGHVHAVSLNPTAQLTQEPVDSRQRLRRISRMLGSHDREEALWEP